MTSKRASFPWISLLYLSCFVFAVASPSFIRGGLLGISETQLEESAIFLFGLTGILSFVFYERAAERREEERKKAQDEFTRVQTELIESYAYIGSVNRKIELLKKVADTATVNMAVGTRLPKEIFHALASHARAVMDAQSALIRFVDLDRLRTEREFSHHPEEPVVFRVPNRELREIKESGRSHAYRDEEDGSRVLIVPSDSSESIKGYLFLRAFEREVGDVDASLLKVFVNQADMLYRHFTNGKDQAVSPRLPVLGEVR